MTVQTAKILPPTLTYRGTRGIDAWGAGGFGAPRELPTAGAPEYKHKGLDCISVPTDLTPMPFDGFIESPNGIAYPDGDLGSIHLRGEGAWSDMRIKLLYVKATLAFSVGLHFKRGAIIGAAQDVAGYWQPKHPERAPMTNHVHLEVYTRKGSLWVLDNPADYLEI